MGNEIEGVAWPRTSLRSLLVTGVRIQCCGILVLGGCCWLVGYRPLESVGLGIIGSAFLAYGAVGLLWLTPLILCIRESVISGRIVVSALCTITLAYTTSYCVAVLCALYLALQSIPGVRLYLYHQGFAGWHAFVTLGLSGWLCALITRQALLWLHTRE